MLAGGIRVESGGRIAPGRGWACAMQSRWFDAMAVPEFFRDGV
ncbi:MAG TPA: hypothetical protein VKO85_07445 [Wenzhouxiangellaceae bacterium]|nr:hypothetical protein [Wenzhouxiangellaceae bacterium]